jgi:hypothetical protein
VEQDAHIYKVAAESSYVRDLVALSAVVELRSVAE